MVLESDKAVLEIKPLSTGILCYLRISVVLKVDKSSLLRIVCNTFLRGQGVPPEVFCCLRSIFLLLRQLVE